MWDEPCDFISPCICGQRRPRSACASAQSDLGLRSPLTESIDTVRGEQRSGWDTEHAHDDLNLRILRMLEDLYMNLNGAWLIMIIILPLRMFNYSVFGFNGFETA